MFRFALKTVWGALLPSALGAATAIVLVAVVAPIRAQTAATTAVISIDNFTFKPQTLTVKSGTTVTWTNKDDIPHGIASASGAFAKSKALDTDDAYSFTFTTPGTYQYFCYIHPHMTGNIVVEAAAGSNSTAQ